jgi:hypothetical protein
VLRSNQIQVANLALAPSEVGYSRAVRIIET